jgi:TDG/mug DNA glycosylase family protein
VFENPVSLFPRPSAADLAAARGRRVKDLIRPGLRVLFCGINPSLYSAAVGHHFARPGNRFYKTLVLSGFTPRLLAPAEQAELLALGLGITNLVDRATANAAELDEQDYREGLVKLARKVKRYEPRCVAFLGLDAYRRATARPHAQVGRQSARLAGAWVWALPNPSGLNAHYQLPELAAAYAPLAAEVGLKRTP